MDATKKASSASVLSEVERKREKLEELKRERARREEKATQVKTATDHSSSAVRDGTSRYDSARKADDLLQQLGIPARAPSMMTPVPPGRENDGVFKAPFDVASHRPAGGGDPGVTPAKHSGGVHLQQHAATSVKFTIPKQLDFGDTNHYVSASTSKLPHNFSSNNMVNGIAAPITPFYRPNLKIQVGLCRSSIVPREAVKYDRETQTSGMERAENPSVAKNYYTLAYDDLAGGASEDFRNQLEQLEFDAQPVVNGPTAAPAAAAAAAAASRRNLLLSMSELSTEQQSLAEDENDNNSADFGVEQLNDEQRQVLFSNENFVKQFKHVTTVMERILSSGAASTQNQTLPGSGTSSTTLKLTQSVSSIMSQSVSSTKIDAQFPTTPNFDAATIENSALRDYYGSYDDDDDDDDRSGRSVNVSIRARFYDDKYCRNKSVSHIACASQQQNHNLVAASYYYDDLHANFGSSGAGEGSHVMIWNLDYPNKTSADDIFRSLTSPITVCEFNTYHRSLLVGGTESGQICMWDMRSPRRTPVQTTAVSVKSHCHPVHSLHVGGASNAAAGNSGFSANSHDLVSCSTDGRVCAWNIDNLSQPLEVLELHHRQNRLSTTCMRFLSGDWNNMLVGAEDGQVVSAYRHGQSPGIWESYESHAGPVNGIDCHPKSSISTGNFDFSQLFLTCSFDWSVKLRCWRESAPFYTFSTFAHFVTDCKWSNAHPAVFAACDESGLVHFYNLNREIELPVVKIDAGESWPGDFQRAAMTKLAWDTNHGYILCCGDRAGRVTIIDARELMGINGEVAQDEYTKFARVVNDMRQRVSTTMHAAIGGGEMRSNPVLSSGKSISEQLNTSFILAQQSSVTTRDAAAPNSVNVNGTAFAVTEATDATNDAVSIKSTTQTAENVASSAAPPPTAADDAVSTSPSKSSTAGAVNPTTAAGFFNRILGGSKS